MLSHIYTKRPMDDANEHISIYIFFFYQKYQYVSRFLSVTCQYSIVCLNSMVV